MKIKTSELIGPALDWAVAKCQDPQMALAMAEVGMIFEGYNYSTNWAQGGPIIDREKISTRFRDLGPNSYWHAEAHEAYRGNMYIEGKGPTPLIAAMRAFVASKLGDEVDVPDELAGEA